MANLTDNVETDLLNWIFNNTDMPASSTEVYVALHTADPTESPDGSTEVDAGTTSYDRRATSPADWTISGNQASNDVEIDFPQATEDWGTITHFSVWNGATATDYPFFSDYIEDSNGDQTSKTVTMDDTISFAAGTLTATFD